MRLLLYNIKYGTNNLGKWSWISFLSHSSQHFMNLERFVKAVNPDLIGLVEVDGGSYRSHGENQADKLSELGYDVMARTKYPVNSISARLPVLSKQSNAVLSRLPLESITYKDFSVGMKRLVIIAEFKDVVFYLVHLALAVKTRHRQLGELYDLIKKSTKPCIVAGDFNLLAGSWESQLFLHAAGLKEVNPLCRPTFPSWNPVKQLDFICYSPSITLKRLRIPRILVSDHLPLVCDFELC